MRKSGLLIILIFITETGFCQEEKLSESIIKVAEELASDESDQGAVEIYIEMLQELFENPVMINSSDETEISRLFFLTDFQVRALMDYTRTTGNIVSSYELSNIPGFDREVVELMIPFISLSNKVIESTGSAAWRNTLLANFSFKLKTEDTTALGSPYKFLSKYKFTAGRVSGGFTIEKDAGEKFLAGDPPLPDFFSGFLAYNSTGIIRKFIIGDFSARFGHGTNINTGIHTGLSLSSPGYMSARDNIRPYTSVNEHNFFRGIVTEFSLRNLGIVFFYSRNIIDAKLDSITGSSETHIENFYTSGLHNTHYLLSRKDVVSEISYGANLLLNLKNARIGFIWSENRFSSPVRLSGSNPGELFDFEGDKNDIYSIYYNYILKRILLHGEFSVAYNKNKAFVQGFSLRPSDRLIINLLYRNYDKGYFSFHGNGPGNSSLTRNQEGLFGNFTFEIAKYLFISAGCDIVHYPWLKYRCNAPSAGKKQEIKLKYLPSDKLTFEASWSSRQTMVNESESAGITKQTEITSGTVKCLLKYSPAVNLSFSSRFDYKTVNSTGSRGMLLLQDINYRFRSVPFTLWCRYCLFNTEDWESRLYTYENDLLYSFSIPALHGKGSRTYLMLKWDFDDYTDLRVKYGITSKTENPDEVDNIEEVKLQLMIRF
jgi:hypothetical protein